MAAVAPFPGIEAAPRAAASQRVALVAPDAVTASDLHGGLLRAIRAHRHQVRVYLPQDGPGESDGDGAAPLRELGAEIVRLPPRARRALFSGRSPAAALAAAFAEWCPHVVIASGADGLVEAPRAAARAGVARIVGLVTELPAGVSGAGGVGGLMEARRSRMALKACHHIVCFNSDDARLLASLGIAAGPRHLTVVAGPGVDLERATVLPLPPLADGLVFLMNAPLEPRNGVREYLAAARRVRERAPTARFILAGREGRGADALHRAEIATKDSAVELAGSFRDNRELLAGAHVFVLPSHGDATPRTVLEALAAGRPVVSTATRGCREMVDERVNGVLVPPGDAESLAAALQSFLKRPDLIPSMARASRLKAERRFDERQINAALLGALGLL